jgi:hypothetical protein
VNKTVKYCTAKLPSRINLNNVLGVVIKNLTWTTTSVTAADGFDANLGVLDIGKYIASKGAGDATLVFKINAAAPLCGVNPNTTLTIHLVGDLN